MIRFEAITKKYEQKTIIDSLNLEINQGELAVLIGPSGCGKTTLLKMINRLIRPSSGRIFIKDEDITSKNEIDLRRNIGYVIQQTGLFPHMTVRENIEIIPRLEKRSAEQIAKKSLELMDMVGLDPMEFLDRYPSQLSGGQQQRIGVARAFACDPDVILMDEPFSALDPLTRSQLQDELADLQAKVQKTIVFVTHDMDEAIKIGDRICLLNQGKVVQYDTPEEMMKNPANDFAAEFIGRNRIWLSPEFIRARDIMVHNPVCGFADMTALRCIERMRSRKVDRLFITDRQMNLLGVISAQTIQGVSNKNLPVKVIMGPANHKIHPDENIIEILQLVNREQLSAVPVVDNENTLLGLITRSSLVTTLSQQYLETPEVV